MPSAAPRTVAITGLRTFLGRRLADRLAEERPRTGVVGIDLRRPHGLHPRVRFHRVDLTEPTADGALADVLRKEGVDALVHLAFRREATPDLEADHELDTIGSLHVLHACTAAEVGRLVLASTTMVYGPYPDNPNYLEESRPLRGHPGAHGVQNRIETERLAERWSAESPGATLTVLRPCWIMGPRYEDAVVRHFDRPAVPTVMGYDPLLQLVHEEDVLRAFERAVLGRHPGVYNVVGEGVLPLSMVLRIAGKRALPVPAPLLVRLQRYAWEARTGDPPEGFYDYLRYLWVADGRRGWAAFGRPRYSSREAWMARVSWHRLRRFR